MSDVEELLGLEPLAPDDRVRIRLSAECPELNPLNAYCIHADWGADGLEGKVLVRALPWQNRGHNYWVIFTAPGDMQHATWFARSELERVH